MQRPHPDGDAVMSKDLEWVLNLAERSLMLHIYSVKLNLWNKVGEMAASEDEEQVFDRAQYVISILNEQRQ